MKILILSWRDIKNPAGGGAEILTHELAKDWTKQGQDVTVFSSKFLGAKPTETIDGVRFIRKGHWWNVHFFAYFYYLNNRSKFDIIIDEVHWFPFFSAIYAKKKTVALTCETASKLFFTLFPYPIAVFFRMIERFYLYLYKNVPTMTISESTKKDLIREGIDPKKITVLKMGINIPKNLKKYPKEKNPTFIYLARINKQKGIFDAIEAFSIIKSKLENSKFWIVGSGEEGIVKEVKELVKKNGLERDVNFFGFVNDEKKYELLSRAHILIIPSAHEGWGLTVHEAASQNTPSIVYNVPGLRDTVKNGVTGFVVEKNTPEELAKEAIKLIRNTERYSMFLHKTEHMMTNAMSWESAAMTSNSLISNLKTY